MKKTMLTLLVLLFAVAAPAQQVDEESQRLTAMKGPLQTERLPQPVYAENSDFVDLYWKAWQLAWDRVRYQNGVFQSPYMDENLWDDTIWIWDTEFMVLFCRYAPDIFPGIQSLENFYESILNGKPSALRIQHPDNPPFYSWVEYEYYKMTGDRARIEKVLVKDRFLQRHYDWFDSLRRGTQLHFKHAPIMLEKSPTGLGYRWGNIQSGMDNTPRADGGRELLWMDALAQQALSALYIERLAHELGDKAVAREFHKRYIANKELLNKWYWDSEDGFYYDLNEADSSLVKVRTPAVYWAMLAEVPGRQQAARLAAYASDSTEFGGRYPWPTVSRSDTTFDARYGDYWRGAIWLPTAYMSTKALETYGYHDLAHRNAVNLLTQMSETYKNFEPHTIWECYSPTVDEPSYHVRPSELECVRPDFCGWSALGPISLFIENVIGFYNIDANRRLVEWNRNSDAECGIRNLHFGNITTDIIAEGRTLRVKSNAPYTLRINGKNYKIKAGDTQRNI